MRSPFIAASPSSSSHELPASVLTFDFLIPAVSHNLGSESKKAAGMPLYMAIGQCGAVLGSHLYPLTEGPRYMYVSRLLSAF